jgi:hypothetical protein
MVCLMANQMHEEKAIKPESTAWYEKKVATFADFIKSVRRQLWRDSSFCQKAFETPSEENDPPDKASLLELFIECLSRTG